MRQSSSIFFLSGAISMSLSGCVTSQSRIESLGLSVGDRLQLKSEAIRFPCEQVLTTVEAQIGGGTSVTCLAAKGNHYPSMSGYDGGKILSIKKILFESGVGSILEVADVSQGTDFWVEDFQVSEMFEKAPHP